MSAVKLPKFTTADYCTGTLVRYWTTGTTSPQYNTTCWSQSLRLYREQGPKSRDPVPQQTLVHSSDSTSTLPVVLYRVTSTQCTLYTCYRLTAVPGVVPCTSTLVLVQCILRPVLPVPAAAATDY